MTTLLERLNGQIPANALQFDAPMETVQSGKGLKVKIKARQRGAVAHPFWGDKVVHDFSTMKMASKIPLDDSHGDEIGFGRPSLTEYGLEIEGTVVPNLANPQHASNRILFNLTAGIPQQGSIDTSGKYSVTLVERDATTTVNGLPLTGPAVIIGDSELRAVAVCEKGVDSSTSAVAQFSADTKFAPQPSKITVIGKQEMAAVTENKTAMSDTTTQAASIAEKNPAQLSISPATETVKVEDAKAETATAEAAVETPQSVETPKVDETIPVEQQPAKETATQLTAEVKSMFDQMAAKISNLEARLSVANKPVVQPAPSVPSDVTQVAQPATWTAAIKKAKELNPKLSGTDAVNFAAKQWPDLQKSAMTAAPRFKTGAK